MPDSKPFSGSDDPQLREGRRQCFVALYNFNKNAIHPTTSDIERSSLFSHIIPKENIGMHVEVEAGFHCQYGHYISIGDEVTISENCRILDAGRVTIGARSLIGPDVSIYTIDGYSEKGHNFPWDKRRCIAKPVVIEEDCWIGGRAPYSGWSEGWEEQHCQGWNLR